MAFRIVLLQFATLTFAVSALPNTAVRLNGEAFDRAAALITQDHFVADKKGAWRSHRPTRFQENEFIRNHGFAEYGKWYLALDEWHAEDSKARYKFPFGDFEKLHRCGLLAVKARAHEYGYRKIEAAAVTLLKMIDSAGPTHQKRID